MTGHWTGSRHPDPLEPAAVVTGDGGGGEKDLSFPFSSYLSLSSYLSKKMRKLTFHSSFLLMRHMRMSRVCD